MILRKICLYCGLTPQRVFGKTGRAYVLTRIDNYNHAARFSRWAALVDLDREPNCVPEFVSKVLPHPSRCMSFRVAVRSVESWLLADRERLARFLAVSEAVVPADPDALADPKAAMLTLARRSSSSRIRRDMVPRAQGGAVEGPAYASRLQEFVNQISASWRVSVAARNSGSLRRCVAALRRLRHCAPE